MFAVAAYPWTFSFRPPADDDIVAFYFRAANGAQEYADLEHPAGGASTPGFIRFSDVFIDIAAAWRHAALRRCGFIEAMAALVERVLRQEGF